MINHTQQREDTAKALGIHTARKGRVRRRQYRREKSYQCRVTASTDQRNDLRLRGGML